MLYLSKRAQVRKMRIFQMEIIPDEKYGHSSICFVGIRYIDIPNRDLKRKAQNISAVPKKAFFNSIPIKKIADSL